jgi:hypothetical protein
MPALQELRAVGMAALQLPRALQPGGYGSIQHVAGGNARYPVLLVHGYAASESVWTPLRRALAGAGFGHSVSLTCNSFATDPEAVGDHVVPPASARLDDPRFGAANLLIPGCGHLTICRDMRLIRSLVPELIRTETFAGRGAPTDAGRELVAA